MTTPLPADHPGREYLLAFADDEHLVGARHTAWIGLGPFLEEDLTFCSIAQDELGHAIALYAYLTDDVDRFALLRDPAEYRSCHLAELECAGWDDALVRHWLHDDAEELRWAALGRSELDGLADLAAQVDREESFHRAHAAAYLGRLTDRPEAMARIQASLDRLAPAAAGVFEPVAGEADALASGVAAVPSADLDAEYRHRISTRAADLGLRLDWAAVTPPDQAHRTRRAPGTPEFLASLREVLDLDTTATW